MNAKKLILSFITTIVVLGLLAALVWLVIEYQILVVVLVLVLIIWAYIYTEFFQK